MSGACLCTSTVSLSMRTFFHEIIFIAAITAVQAWYIPPFDFIADHPFFYSIVRVTQDLEYVSLFQGHVYKPEIKNDWRLTFDMYDKVFD